LREYLHGQNNNQFETRLWAAADQLWANSNLKPSEFSTPVLGLIFLRYANHRFTEAEAEFAKVQGAVSTRKVGKLDYQAKGVLYLPEESRFPRIRNMPEGGRTSPMPSSRPCGPSRRKSRSFCRRPKNGLIIRLSWS